MSSNKLQSSKLEWAATNGTAINILINNRSLAMAMAHNDPMKSVNDTIEAFFSTNQDHREKYTIYLDKQNLNEDVKFIKSAFHNIPGIISVDVDTENASVEITSKNVEEAYTDLFKKYGYSVIATDHDVTHS